MEPAEAHCTVHHCEGTDPTVDLLENTRLHCRGILLNMVWSTKAFQYYSHRLTDYNLAFIIDHMHHLHGHSIVDVPVFGSIIAWQWKINEIVPPRLLSLQKPDLCDKHWTVIQSIVQHLAQIITIKTGLLNYIPEQILPVFCQFFTQKGREYGGKTSLICLNVLSHTGSF